MSQTRRCPMCEVQLSDETSALGLCPGCLLHLGLSDPQPPVRPPGPPPRRRWLRRIVFATLAVAVPLMLFSLFRAAPRPARAVRFQIDPPPNAEFTEADPLEISPDGTQVAFTATGLDGERQIWLRSLDSFAAKEIPQTAGGRLPFWAPDSRSVAFFAQGKLKRISISGGPPQTICDAPTGRGGAWNRTGIILFTPRATGALFQVPASGGSLQPVTTLDRARREVSHAWPRFLPDGRSFLFVATSENGDTALYAATPGSTRRTLIGGNMKAALFAQRFLIFIRENLLMAQPFDPVRLHSRGEPIPVPFAGQVAAVSASDDHVLAYRAGPPREIQLAWFYRDGQMLGPVSSAAIFAGFALSPDGKTIASARRASPTGNQNLWLTDLSRDITSRFTFGPGSDAAPVWSPDGRSIAFVSTTGEDASIFEKRTDGTDNQRLLLRSKNPIRLNSWSADGQFLLYTLWDYQEKPSLWLLPLADGHKPKLILPHSQTGMQGELSPDGQWLAYVSAESGRNEVYVQSFPTPSTRWQASADGGTLPHWGPDSGELFYLSRERKLIAVRLRGAGETLFPMPIRGPYAVAAGGQRFLMETGPPKMAKPVIQVVLDWTAGLRQ